MKEIQNIQNKSHNQLRAMLARMGLVGSMRITTETGRAAHYQGNPIMHRSRKPSGVAKAKRLAKKRNNIRKNG